MMADSNKVMCFLLIEALLALELARASPRLDVSPAQIDLGLSTALDVNCSISLEPSSDLVGIISIIASRENGSEYGFMELAAISQYTKQTVTEMTSEKITATGIIDPAAESYLNIHWDFPDKLQSGTYICAVHGFDHIGRVTIVMTNIVEVKFGQPSIDDYTNSMKDMTIKMKALTDRVSGLEATLETRDQQMEKRLSALEKQQLHQAFEEPLEYQDRRYYVSKESYTNITVSMAACKLFGGWLVEIDDGDEHQAIQAFLRAITGYTLVVIAGTDEDKEGVWISPSTNQPMAYLDLHSGQPDGGRTENCLTLCAPPSWKTCDLPCFYSSKPATIRYMCEVPLV